MHPVPVAQGMSILDMGIQYYGCAEGAVQFMNDNPGLLLAIDQYIKPGTLLQCEDVVPVMNTTNNAVNAYYVKHNIKVSTGMGGPVISTDTTDIPIETEDEMLIAPDE